MKIVELALFCLSSIIIGLFGSQAAKAHLPCPHVQFMWALDQRFLILVSGNWNQEPWALSSL